MIRFHQLQSDQVARYWAVFSPLHYDYGTERQPLQNGARKYLAVLDGKVVGFVAVIHHFGRVARGQDTWRLHKVVASPDSMWGEIADAIAEFYAKNGMTVSSVAPTRCAEQLGPEWKHLHPRRDGLVGHKFEPTPEPTPEPTLPMTVTEVETLARSLMDKHGLSKWEFKWDGAKRRFGVCRYKTKTISMSRVITGLNLDNRAEIRNVILHEIAHALAPKDEGHGPKWKAIAKSIGCTGDRCYDSSTVNTPPSKYLGFCKHCGRVRELNRETDHSCGSCSGEYSPKYRVIIREREEIEKAGGIDAYKGQWALDNDIVFAAGGAQ